MRFFNRSSDLEAATPRDNPPLPPNTDPADAALPLSPRSSLAQILRKHTQRAGLEQDNQRADPAERQLPPCPPSQNDGPQQNSILSLSTSVPAQNHLIQPDTQPAQLAEHRLSDCQSGQNDRANSDTAELAEHRLSTCSPYQSDQAQENTTVAEHRLSTCSPSQNGRAQSDPPRARTSGDLLSTYHKTPSDTPATEVLSVHNRSTFPSIPNNSEAPDTSIMPQKLAEFLEKYDPRPKPFPTLLSMSEHRAMMRLMYVENILYTTARLHKHRWILLSQNEKYQELLTPERWRQIQEDLEGYTKAVKNYEYWCTSTIQNINLDPDMLPPGYTTYGKTLAILECASHPSHVDESEFPFLQALREEMFLSQANWSSKDPSIGQLGSSLGKKRKEQDRHTVRKIGVRIFLAIFVAAMIVIPAVVMIFDRTTKTFLVTINVFTFVIAMIFALCLEGVSYRDIIMATAGYAVVLIIFAGQLMPGNMNVSGGHRVGLEGNNTGRLPNRYT